MALPTPAYGNYQAYYAKRGTSVLLGDRRIARLPKAWVTGRRVLDIGANSGLPSVALGAGAFRPAQATEPILTGISVSSRTDLVPGLAGAAAVTGVDICSDLVRKAQTHLAFVESLREPTTGSANYFPVALPKEHGFLPPIQDADAAGVSPTTVSFVAADWVTDEIDADAEGYDLVLACVVRAWHCCTYIPSRVEADVRSRLSLTKWIHLHHGDAGLRRFFAKIHRVLAPGGRLVLEPQAWATYKDAAKKTRGAVPRSRLAELKLRPTEFGQILEALGFERDGLLREAGGLNEQYSIDADQAGTLPASQSYGPSCCFRC